MLKWLQLLRLPTVFTAMADVCCGYFIAASLTLELATSWNVLPWLLVSSAGLYLSGMVLNDVFDAQLDATERPERPIPSGRIAGGAAAVVGSLLLVLGITSAGVAWLTAEQNGHSPHLAVLIAVAVLAYDIVLKSTWAGPFGMAACRFLNLSLGASATVGTVGEVLSWQLPVVGASTGLAVYIVGVTWFARNEAGNASRFGLAGGLAVAALGIAVTAVIVLWNQTDLATAAAGLAQYAVIFVVTIVRGTAAIRSGQPRVLQRTVGKMLLWIIVLDAVSVFAATGNAMLEAIILLLIIPAVALRRHIPMS